MSTLPSDAMKVTIGLLVLAAALAAASTSKTAVTGQASVRREAPNGSIGSGTCPLNRNAFARPVDGASMVAVSTRRSAHRRRGSQRPSPEHVAPTPSATPTTILRPAVLIAGGTGMVKVPAGESPAVLAAAEIYIPTTNQFVPIEPMTTSRSHQGAVVLPSGGVLIVGGVEAIFVPQFSGPTVPWILSSSEVFNPANGRFANAAAMSVGRDSPTVTLLDGGKALIIGGGSASTELYDPQTNKFSSSGTMAAERYGQTATLLQTGKVLVTGGGSAQAELYNPDDGKFTPSGAMTQNRIYHTATLLLDDRVLIAGGSPYARSSAVDTAELFDPLSGTFAPGPRMTRNRAGHTATLLRNGQVLIAGGHDDSSAEIYDPVAEQFTATGNMTISRFGHSATLLPDGRVLIAGGFDKSYQPLASAEIYDPVTGSFVAVGSMASPHASHSASLIEVHWPISWAQPTPSPTVTSGVAPTPSMTPTAGETPQTRSPGGTPTSSAPSVTPPTQSPATPSDR